MKDKNKTKKEILNELQEPRQRVFEPEKSETGRRHEQVEEKLSREFALLNRIIDTGPAGIIVVNHDGKIIFANSGAERILGLEKDKITQLAYNDPKLKITDCDGKPFPDDKLPFLQVMRTKKPVYNLYHAVERPDGRRVMLSTNATPLFDKAGNVDSIAATIEDVTEQVRVEESLRKSEEKYRDLYETMARGVVYQDANGKITSANPAAERILGLTLAQMQGRTSIDPRWRAIHEDGSDFPGEVHPSMVALKTGKRVDNVIMGVFNPKDNEYRWIKINAIPHFRHGENKPYEAYTIFDDITGQKKAEKSLQESEERYRELAESISDVFFAFDKNLKYTYWNKASEKLTGISKKDAAGKSIFEIFPDSEETRKAAEVYQRVLKTQKPESFINEYHIGGKKYFFDISAYPSRTGLSVFAKDITERMQAEEELKMRTRQLGERVKELKALYGISSIVQKASISLEEILRDAVDFIPSGFQYPEITQARIILEGKEYRTENFRETAWKQTSSIIVHGKLSGVVEVCYLEERPEEHEGPFLKEERDLINAIAERLGRITERMQAEEKLKAERQRLLNVLETMPIMVCLLTPDYHVAFANRAFRDRFGESHGRHCYECCFGGKEPCDFCETYGVLKTGKPHHWQVTTTDGASVIDVYDFPFTDVDGSPMILEMDIDITERVKMEEELKKYREHLEELIVERTSELKKTNELLRQGMAERKRADKLIRGQNALLGGINRILLETLTAETDEEIARKCLAIAEDVTGSKFGFICELNPAGLLDTIAISDLGWDACKIPKTNALLMLGDMEIRGIRGRVVKDRQSRIFNNPMSHPEFIAPPKGHPKITCFLGVPLKHKGSTVGMIGLANKKSGYTPADQQTVESLAAVFLEALYRKRAEEELRKSREDYSTLVEKGNDGIIIIQDSLLKFANSNMSEINGFSIGELVEKPFIDFVSPECKELVAGRYEKRLAGEEVPNRYEIEIISKDGRNIPVEINASMIEYRGMPADMAIIRDMTERKKAEKALQKAMEELKEVDRMKDEFFSSVTHELQNPLTPVKIQSQLLLEKSLGELNEKQRESVEIMLINTNRLIKLVDDITTISKIRAGMLKYEMSKSNIVDVIESSVNNIELSAREKRITIVKKYPESLLVECDKDRINQVMNNLIGNAVKFTQDSGKITVEAKRIKNNVAVSVKDTGIGISKKDQKRVFNTFFQVSSKYGGTGLGLTICKSIIEEHHGKIWVESEPGRGSKFTFTLPVTQ